MQPTYPVLLAKRIIPLPRLREACGGCGMGQWEAAIIEPRALMREALISLMTSHSYHVVGAVASTSDIDKSMLVADVPRLVILGALPTGDAIAAAGSIRKLWPETKIILLFEDASSADFL